MLRISKLSLIFIFFLISQLAFAVDPYFKLKLKDNVSPFLGELVKVSFEIYPFNQKVVNFFNNNKNKIITDGIYLHKIEKMESSENNVNVGVGILKVIFFEKNQENNHLKILNTNYLIELTPISFSDNPLNGETIVFERIKTSEEKINYWGYLFALIMLFMFLLFVRQSNLREEKRKEILRTEMVEYFKNIINSEDYNGLLDIKRKEWLYTNFPGKRLIVKMLYDDLNKYLYMKNLSMEDKNNIKQYIDKILV